MTRRSVQTVAKKAGLDNNKFYAAAIMTSEVYEIFTQARSTIQGYLQKKRNAKKFFVSIIDNDEIYRHVQSWLMADLDDNDPRSIVLESQNKYMARKTGSFYNLMYDNKATIDFEHKSFKYTAKITDKDENPEDADSDDVPAMASSMGRGRSSVNGLRQRLLFTCDSSAAREALLDTLAVICEDHVDDAPAVYAAAKWGDWITLQGAPARSIESVILRTGDREKIVADMGRFLDSEVKYDVLGLPWHRGYLFWGEPGTGKTSLARALSSHFRLNAYFMSLSSLDKDTDLGELLTRIPPRSVVLFEDIDVVHASRDRGDDSGVTLGGLLNALDGFVTPHGAILIMTTNNREVLDDALTRPGRVDLELEITYVDDKQLKEMVQFYTKQDIALPPLQSAEITPSQVMDVFKNHLEDPSAAIDELVDKIKVDWVS